jgi:hypothetical protein
MRTRLALLLVALFAAGAARAQTGALRGVDVYGTSRITAEQLREKLGSDFTRLAESIASSDAETFVKAEGKLIDAVREMGPFAFVRISAIMDNDPGRSIYVTVDVVEERDRARRMDFLPAPTGTFQDPEGLLALWGEYEARGFELFRKGENFRNLNCPAFHCLWGFEHPDLRKYEEPFRTGVAKHRDLLVRILREDRDAQHRGRAAYLLAHSKDGTALVQALVPAIRDPSAHVRNNATRVLAQISRKHKEVKIPLAPVLKAIDFPETSDRNKALSVLDGLADDRANHRTIIREAGPTLLRVLRLQQPNNHDPAYSILKKVSGKSFGERDYGAWEAWLQRQRAENR